MAKINIQEYTRALSAELKSYVKQYNTLEYAAEQNGIEELPVGHIIPYMGLTAPRHYLVCDGAEYAAAEYPELFEHLSLFPAETRAQWGNADWSTSFNVPNLQGEFLRGSGANKYANGGTGAAVGVHQAPTQSPNLYSDGNGIIYSNKNQTGSSVQNADVSGVDSNRQYTNKTGDNITTTASWYVSRPTNTAVLFCIRYEPSYNIKVEGKEIYSTEERVIGTWIDSKPIYRKCFSMSYHINDNTSPKVLIAAGVPGIETLVGSKVSSSWGGVFLRDNGIHNSMYVDIYVDNRNGDIGVVVGGSSTLNLTVTGVIVEYTKTTD